MRGILFLCDLASWLFCCSSLFDYCLSKLNWTNFFSMIFYAWLIHQKNEKYNRIFKKNEFATKKIIILVQTHSIAKRYMIQKYTAVSLSLPSSPSPFSWAFVVLEPFPAVHHNLPFYNLCKKTNWIEFFLLFGWHWLSYTHTLHFVKKEKKSLVVIITCLPKFIILSSDEKWNHMALYKILRHTTTRHTCNPLRSSQDKKIWYSLSQSRLLDWILVLVCEFMRCGTW